ncbi:MAG: thiamine phosphate synthase, partial [Actinobacteria bacterium]|nr:thiamine phosphate synthase [Actinomycetota bacterium]
YAAALEVGRLCRRAGAGFLVNDRLDVALAAGADGVHLAKRSLPPAAVRPLLRPGMILGCSVHSLEEAVAAAEGGAGYLTFGHVYPTSSHPGQPPRGVSELARVVRAVPVPVLAIGGITPDNAGPVLATGCAGIVVISAILSESDPARAARVLREAVDSFHHRPRFPFPGPARAGESKNTRRS